MSGAGRPSSGNVDVTHRPALYQIVQREPWLFIDEIVERMNTHPSVINKQYKINHIQRQLIRDGFSLKKMRKFAAEQNSAKRMKYWEEMVQIVMHPAQLVFIDETSKDGRTLRRANGRSLAGKRIEQRETLLRGRRVSILGVFAFEGFVDWHWVEEGYSADEFLSAVRHHVIPHLNPYPQRNSILVSTGTFLRASTHTLAHRYSTTAQCTTRTWTC